MPLGYRNACVRVLSQTIQNVPLDPVVTPFTLMPILPPQEETASTTVTTTTTTAVEESARAANCGRDLSNTLLQQSIVMMLAESGYEGRQLQRKVYL